MKKRNLIRYRLVVFAIVHAVVLLGFIIFSMSEAGGMKRILLAAGAVGLTTLSVLSFWFFIYKPYQQVRKKVAAFVAGGPADDLVSLSYNYDEQINDLFTQVINSMQDSTSMQLTVRQAQFLALQNQINPHFLYNTLESIRSEALISGLDSVGEMCEALATFFRYTISNKKDIVTIEEELENVETYFYIQKYRFGERLHLSLKIAKEEEDAILKCLIPKLILQPIVENAIIHGLENKADEGEVEIQIIRTVNDLVIYVTDNGIGMDKILLDQINRHMVDRNVSQKERGSIAIGNVNNRLKMKFGERYGVIVYSAVGIGTKVEITIPYTTEQEEKADYSRGQDEKRSFKNGSHCL